MGLQQRVDEHERRFVLAEKRLDRIEKQINATSKLVDFGMKMIIRDRKQQKEADEGFHDKLNALIHSQQQTDEKLKELAEQQMRTDAKFERFIDELRRRNGNGHSS